MQLFSEPFGAAAAQAGERSFARAPRRDRTTGAAFPAPGAGAARRCAALAPFRP